jgi:hypothetical protein
MQVSVESETRYSKEGRRKGSSRCLGGFERWSLKTDGKFAWFAPPYRNVDFVSELYQRSWLVRGGHMHGGLPGVPRTMLRFPCMFSCIKSRPYMLPIKACRRGPHVFRVHCKNKVLTAARASGGVGVCETSCSRVTDATMQGYLRIHGRVVMHSTRRGSSGGLV